jgi:hypothetical protein
LRSETLTSAQVEVAAGGNRQGNRAPDGEERQTGRPIAHSEFVGPLFNRAKAERDALKARREEALAAAKKAADTPLT